MEYKKITAPWDFPFPKVGKPQPFTPPKQKPQGKKKYIIEGETYYLISKKDLEAEIQASVVAGVHLKKKELMESAREELMKEHEIFRAQCDKEVNELWDQRAAMFRAGDSEENFMNLLQFLLSVPCRILVEEFGWKPVPADGHFDKRHKLMKFMDMVAQAIQDICEDEDKDIMRYSEETFEKYGVKFDFGANEGTHRFEESGKK